MKDYEKAAIAIGAAALGLAAYQAHKTKQAVDATEATDPSRNPIQAAIDLSGHVIGSTASWLTQRLDKATGFVKGKSEDVINTMKAVTYSPLYVVEKAKDFGKNAAEAGSKYLWNGMGLINATGKKLIEPLTNKPFTLMGATVTSDIQTRYLPTMVGYIGDLKTSIGSKREEITKKTGSLLGGLKDRMVSILPWRR